MKAITTRSGVAYEGPSIPTNPLLRKVVERETEETTDKEQINFQRSIAQIPPPVIPISIPKPDVPKTLPKTTPIPEPDVPKSLPKQNIPYPSRRDDQKSRDKASNQMENIFQIFQDLRFDISFADALLLMPRFTPTIKSLLINKEKLLELAKISLNENCSAMLLKKLLEKLGDPGKFLIPISRNGFRNFHFPIDFVVVDFEADPRVPLILGRSFLRTSRALIDVYEGELVLRDGNAQITFHVNGTSKHPQKHENESIKLVNDAYKDSFKRFTNKPALVCLTPPKDVNDEKEKQEVKNLTELTAKCQTLLLVLRKLSQSQENPRIHPGVIVRTFYLRVMIFLPSTFSDDSMTFSNLLFEFDVNFKNPLFDEVLEDIECKDSYDSNLDESTFLVTPLSDSNKDKCLTPEDDIEILLHHDPSTPLKSVASILEGFINDPPFEENDDLFDLECKTNDEAELFMFMGDNDEIDGFLAIFFFEVPSIIMESHEDYINRMSLLCGNSSSRSPENFHTIIESLPTSTTLVEDNDSNREEIYIFSRPDDSIPPGVESDFDSEEDIINNLLNDDPIHEYEHLTFDIETIVP
ncbi:reverse transcriptase domain-containing protein [Tanacetum coccineum]